MSSNDIISNFWTKLDDSPTVMIGAQDQHAHSEPMRVFFDRDKRANELFIYTSSGNRLVEAIEAGNRSAMLQFVGKGHDFFACIAANIERVEDPGLIDTFWSESVAKWFDGGRADPQLRMIRVALRDGEMWEVDLGLGGKLKAVFGGAIGPDDIDGDNAKVALG